MTTRTFLIADYKTQRYQCPLTPEKNTYFLSGNLEADIYIPGYQSREDSTGHVNSITAGFSEDGTLQVLMVITGNFSEAISIQRGRNTQVGDILFHIEDHSPDIVEIYLETEETIKIGQQFSNDIVLTHCRDPFSCALVKEEEAGWTLQIANSAEEPVYVNGTLWTATAPLEPGDLIHLSGSYLIEMGEGFITLHHQNAYHLHNLTLYTSPDPPETRYPDFQRPPRKIHPEPTDKVTLPHPPSQPQKDRFGLLIRLAPMLAMILIWVVIGTMWGRGWYMMLFAVAISVTGIVTAYRYVKDKKHKKVEERERVAFYENLLNRKRKQIRELLHKQRQALEHTYPTPQETLAIAQTFSPRLWERAPDHSDFLHLRIGLGNQPLSFTVEYNPRETKEAEKDPLTKDAEKLAAKFTHNPSLPLSISLKDANVGIIGSKDQTLPHTLALLAQLTILHSYLDITLVIICSSEDISTLHPFKWMPHTWLGDRQYKSLVHNQTTRENILTSIHQILKHRRTEHENTTSKKLQFPPLVIVVTDLDLIYNHAIMEFLSLDHSHLGLHALFLSENEFELPESATTLLTLLSPEEATLYQESNPTLRTYIPDTLSRDDIEKAARALAPIHHIMTSADESMPDTVTLFDLFNRNFRPKKPGNPCGERDCQLFWLS